MESIMPGLMCKGGCGRNLTENPHFAMGRKAHCKICNKWSRSSENDIQIEFFRRLRNELPELATITHHVPNGGNIGGKAGGLLKKMGVKKGVWDVCIPLTPVVYVEFKSFKGSLTKEQEEFRRNMLYLNPDAKFRIFRNPDVAIKEIVKLML